MASIQKKSCIPFKQNKDSEKQNIKDLEQNCFKQLSKPNIFKTEFKNQTQEWLVKKKKVQMFEDQELIDQFNCGYAGNIVVTGKLYITNNRVCFYSAFNDKNIFFDSTFIQIRKQDILKIQKRHNAKIFDNSIQITLRNLETVFFTSFVSRDQCYDLMISLYEKPQVTHHLKNLKRKSDYDYDTEFLMSKIILQEFEYLIHSFSCGLATKINIMGRIYITNKRIYFYSFFNEEGIPLIDTQINIPAEEILNIQKRYNALICDNSILVIAKQGSFFFTSFLSRDTVFYILLDVFVYGKQISKISQQNEQSYQKILENTDKQEQFGHGVQKLNQSVKADFIQHQNLMLEEFKLKIKKQSKISTYQQDIDTQKVSQEQFMKKSLQNDDISKEQEKQREYKVNRILNKQNNLEIIGQTVLSFPGINAIKALRIFDSGQQIFMNGKNYENFMAFFKTQIMKVKNLKISRWSPNILQFLNTSNIKNTCPLQFQRDIEQIFKLQKSGIPFMPKQAKSKESQRLFLISKDKYIIESYVQSSGAPFADSFHNNGRRIVQTLSDNSIKITVSMQTIFKKRPILGSLIQDKCQEQGIKHQKSMFDAMKCYLKNLEQNKIKK